MRCVSPVADSTAIRTRAVRTRVTGRSNPGVLGDPAADRRANGGRGDTTRFILTIPVELQSHSLIITRQCFPLRRVRYNRSLISNTYDAYDPTSCCGRADVS